MWTRRHFNQTYIAGIEIGREGEVRLVGFRFVRQVSTRANALELSKPASVCDFACRAQAEPPFARAHRRDLITIWTLHTKNIMKHKISYSNFGPRAEILPRRISNMACSHRACSSTSRYNSHGFGKQTFARCAIINAITRTSVTVCIVVRDIK